MFFKVTKKKTTLKIITFFFHFDIAAKLNFPFWFKKNFFFLLPQFLVLLANKRANMG